LGSLEGVPKADFSVALNGDGVGAAVVPELEEDRPAPGRLNWNLAPPFEAGWLLGALLTGGNPRPREGVSFDFGGAVVGVLVDAEGLNEPDGGNGNADAGAGGFDLASAGAAVGVAAKGEATDAAGANGEGAAEGRANGEAEDFASAGFADGVPSGGVKL
jgi:hypothetical protein